MEKQIVKYNRMRIASLHKALKSDFDFIVKLNLNEAV